MNTKEMALELSKKVPYEPADDRILVKPLKPVMLTKEFPVQPKTAPETLEQVESTVVEYEKRKVEANTSKGVIIKLGVDYVNMLNCPYEVGDIVCYPRNAGIPFELFKDSRMLRKYEILGKVIENA
jgi:hypothetical protein